MRRRARNPSLEVVRLEYGSARETDRMRGETQVRRSGQAAGWVDGLTGQAGAWPSGAAVGVKCDLLRESPGRRDLQGRWGEITSRARRHHDTVAAGLPGRHRMDGQPAFRFSATLDLRGPELTAVPLLLMNGITPSRGRSSHPRREAWCSARASSLRNTRRVARECALSH